MPVDVVLAADSGAIEDDDDDVARSVEVDEVVSVDETRSDEVVETTVPAAAQ